jgi:hypothetical protein
MNDTRCFFEEHSPEAVLERLREARLSVALRRDLALHLAAPCPRCDELFATPEMESRLAALCAAVEDRLPAARPGDLAAAWEGIESGISESAPRRSLWSRLFAPAWTPAALAFVLIVAVALPLLVARTGAPPEPAWREKTAGAWPVPTLTVLHARRRDAVQGPVNGPVAVGDHLLFRLGIGRAGPALLSVVDEGGHEEVLHRARLPAGDHEVAAAGQALAYRCTRPGRLRFRLTLGEGEGASSSEVHVEVRR